MMPNEKQGSDHLVLAGLLFLVFSLVIALVFVYTRAGDTTSGGDAITSASINNTAPVVNSVYINDSTSSLASFSSGVPVYLSTSSNMLHVFGIITDDNGEDDLATTSVVFYRTGASGGNACTPDNNDCYTVASCTIYKTHPYAGDDSTNASYDCPISYATWIDATDGSGSEFPADNWTAYVTVSDLSASTGTLTNTIEVNTLLALNLPTAISYGTFGLGATTTSSNNQETPIEQRGNANADVTVSGTAMACDALGTIPVGNQRWSISDLDYTAAGTYALTGSATSTNLDVEWRHNDSAVDGTAVRTLYWNIGIPTTGVRGTCTGTTTMVIQVQA